MALIERSPVNRLLKRTIVLLLACVLAMAGTMQQRVTASSLGKEGQAPIQRIYEEVEHARLQDLRSQSQRMGLKRAEHRLTRRPPAIDPSAPRMTPVRRPQSPRAPPHQPRAPPQPA